MTRARRLVRWSASSLVALLVLLVIGIRITQTVWVRDWVRMQFVVRAKGALDGELRVLRLGGTLWTGVTSTSSGLSPNGAFLWPSVCLWSTGGFRARLGFTPL